MSSICRITSLGVGICSLHKTTQSVTVILIEGNQNINGDGLSVGTVTSTVLASCGHSAIIIDGQQFTTADGLDIAQIGSQFGVMPTGVMVDGSPNITV